MFAKGPVYEQVVLSLLSPDHWEAMPQGHMTTGQLVELGSGAGR